MMRYSINQSVIVTPNSGPLGGHEFHARIIDIRDSTYIVEDQDSDFFEVDELELTPIND